MRRDRFNYPTWKLIQRDLSFGPATVQDLAESGDVGVHKRNIQRWVTLAREAGLIHIVAWERHIGSPRAVYALGRGKNVPKPERLSDAERKRRQREADRERYNAYQREWKARRDSLTAIAGSAE